MLSGEHVSIDSFPLVPRLKPFQSGATNPAALYVSGRVGEYLDPEMVRAFFVSSEYRTRFGEQ
jgi:hypothetical protein